MLNKSLLPQESEDIEGGIKESEFIKKHLMVLKLNCIYKYEVIVCCIKLIVHV